MFDLLTEHRVLPLLANITDIRGFEMGEMGKLAPERLGSHCMAVIETSGDEHWFCSSEHDWRSMDAAVLEWLRGVLE